MSGHGEKQSRQEEAAVAALLSCGTIADAAGRIGVSESTLRRWLHEPEFAAKYREARQQVVTHAIGALQAKTGKAVAALDRLLECGSPSTEARAALGILEQAFKAAEIGDLIQRLDELAALVGQLRAQSAQQESK